MITKLIIESIICSMNLMFDHDDDDDADDDDLQNSEMDSSIISTLLFYSWISKVASKKKKYSSRVTSVPHYTTAEQYLNYKTLCSNCQVQCGYSYHSVRAGAIWSTLKNPSVDFSRSCISQSSSGHQSWASQVRLHKIPSTGTARASRGI